MRNARELKQRFKNLSLKKKLLIFYSILFVLPLLFISVIIYVDVSESMLDKIQYSAKRSYEQSKSYLEYKILQLIQRTDVVVTNGNLIKMIQESTVRNTDVHKQLGQKEAIRSYLQSVEGSAQSTRLRIYVSDAFGFSAAGENGDYIYRLSQADAAVWYQKKGGQKIYFAPGIYLETDQRSPSVALVRDLPRVDNYQTRSGVLRMDIAVTELEEILWNASPTKNSVTYLINQENIVVAASDADKLEGLGLGEALPEEFLYSKYAVDTEIQESRLQHETVYFMRDKIRNTDWEMITVFPRADMVSDIARIQYRVAGMMLLFGLLTITGGAIIISWIVRRISNLTDSMHQVQQGNRKVALMSDSQDEIGVLYENYNGMMTRTNALIEEQYRMGISLKSAELKALQSQINPHFLYNTLDTVNWLAYAGRAEDIHKAVVSLSKYYRLILNKGRDMLTLEEELQHVGYYMKIQEIRFPEQFHYTENVEAGVKQSMIPKIILQPLVENAILHGIMEKASKRGNISVVGFAENETTVCVQVTDDGAGMDAAALAHLMDGGSVTSGSSYGVKNVHTRLQLTFGDAYGLTYESRESEGTCVSVRFPLSF